MSAFERRERLRRFVYYYLGQTPCVDCGEDRIPVLQFDHRDPKNKRADITTMVKNRVGINTLLHEIHKCDVRCANCHALRTSLDQGWYARI